MTKENKEIYRVLDANANRFLEGLRVLEEYVRFIHPDEKLALACKNLRHRFREMKILMPDTLIEGRNVPDDSLALLSTKTEMNRDSLLDLLSANWQRVKEALRVLEEYGKFISTELALLAKSMRFEAYVLEQQFMSHFKHLSEKE